MTRPNGGEDARRHRLAARQLGAHRRREQRPLHDGAARVGDDAGDADGDLGRQEAHGERAELVGLKRRPACAELRPVRVVDPQHGDDARGVDEEREGGAGAGRAMARRGASSSEQHEADRAGGERRPVRHAGDVARDDELERRAEGVEHRGQSAPRQARRARVSRPARSTSRRRRRPTFEQRAQLVDRRSASGRRARRRAWRRVRPADGCARGR